MSSVKLVIGRRKASLGVLTRWCAVAAVGSFAVVGGGCNNAGEGALSGAAIGALGGMGIGSLSGDMGEGAAIGAIVGGIGGMILGDQNARRLDY